MSEAQRAAIREMEQIREELEGEVPARIYAHHHHEDDPGHPFEGWWHCDEGAAGPGMCSRGYVNGELYDTLQTERHADGEYIGHLQQRVEELEAALKTARDFHERYSDRVGAADGWARDVKRKIDAALTPPEQ